MPTTGKGPVVADSNKVTIRRPDTGEEREVGKNAAKYFANEETGWVVLDSAGRVNTKATSATTKEK
jgi:hypothetical protein